MYRGTTPINKFIVTDIDLSDAVAVYITYKQNGKTVIEKTMEDIEFEEGYLQVRLTQEETLKFKDHVVYIQIRARFFDGSAIASNMIRTSVNNILKDGVI
jgi:hypothetical protein